MPPKVTKQVAKPKPRATVKKAVRKGTSVVDRIAPVGESKPALRMTIYGRGKTGKTRFVSTLPKPMLLIGTEDGTLSISTAKDLDFVRLHKPDEIDDLINLLKTGKYKSVALDHAGNLQDMILQEILGLEELPIQRDWGMAKRDDWTTCGAQTKERLRSLLTLAETDSIDVAIVAHERNFNEESASDLIIPTVGAALTPSVTNWLNGATDYICQTFIREQVIKVPKKVGTKIMGYTERKTDKKEFCLRVGPHPVFMTGFRLPPGIELPELVIDPTHTKIMKLVNP